MIWLFPAAVVAAMLLLLVAPIGFGRSELARAFEDAMHAPLFAVIAIAALLWLRRARPIESFSREYLRALMGAVALGAFGEIAQSMTESRHAEWRDLLYDVLGALAGLSLFALFDKRRRLRTRVRRKLAIPIIVAVVCVAIPVVEASWRQWYRWNQMPDLVSWRSRVGYHHVSAGSAQTSVVFTPSPWSGSQCEAAMYFNPDSPDRWPGLMIEEPVPDWGGYAMLNVDIVNPNDEALRLTLRVNDRQHSNDYADRYNGAFAAPPRARMTISVPLREIETAPQSRRMDMSHISRIVLFQDAEKSAQAFYLCGVRLTR